MIRVRMGGEERWLRSRTPAGCGTRSGAALPVGVPEAFTEPVPDPLGDLLLRYARTHGPFPAARGAARFGLGVAVVAGVLDRLVGHRPAGPRRAAARAARASSTATPRCCAGCGGRRWPGCGPRWSRSSRARWAGSCRRGRACRPGRGRPAGPDAARAGRRGRAGGGGAAGGCAAAGERAGVAGAARPAARLHPRAARRADRGGRGHLDRVRRAGRQRRLARGRPGRRRRPAAARAGARHRRDSAAPGAARGARAGPISTRARGGGALFFRQLADAAGADADRRRGGGAGRRRRGRRAVGPGVGRAAHQRHARRRCGPGWVRRARRHAAHPAGARPRAAATRSCGPGGRPCPAAPGRRRSVAGGRWSSAASPTRPGGRTRAPRRSWSGTACSPGVRSAPSGSAAGSPASTGCCGRWRIPGGAPRLRGRGARCGPVRGARGDRPAAGDVPPGRHPRVGAGARAGRWSTNRPPVPTAGRVRRAGHEPGAWEPASSGARSSERSGPRVVLAAADPAQPYGAALAWPATVGDTKHRPARKAGALVVLVDGAPALYVERGGRSLLSFTTEREELGPRRPGAGRGGARGLAGFAGRRTRRRRRTRSAPRWPRCSPRRGSASRRRGCGCGRRCRGPGTGSGGQLVAVRAPRDRGGVTRSSARSRSAASSGVSCAHDGTRFSWASWPRRNSAVSVRPPWHAPQNARLISSGTGGSPRRTRPNAVEQPSVAASIRVVRAPRSTSRATRHCPNAARVGQGPAADHGARRLDVRAGVQQCVEGLDVVAAGRPVQRRLRVRPRKRASTSAPAWSCAAVAAPREWPGQSVTTCISVLDIAASPMRARVAQPRERQPGLVVEQELQLVAHAFLDGPHGGPRQLVVLVDRDQRRPPPAHQVPESFIVDDPRCHRNAEHHPRAGSSRQESPNSCHR